MPDAVAVKAFCPLCRGLHGRHLEPVWTAEVVYRTPILCQRCARLERERTLASNGTEGARITKALKDPADE